MRSSDSAFGEKMAVRGGPGNTYSGIPLLILKALGHDVVVGAQLGFLEPLISQPDQPSARKHT